MSINQEVRPCPKPGHVISSDGRVVRVPEGWGLLTPGDLLLTRRVKAAGPHWVVKRWRKGRFESLGVWSDQATIDRVRNEVQEIKAAPAYRKRLDAGRARREQAQLSYEATFEAAVLDFLQFPEPHLELAARLAEAITRHAIPVGSGTVARTQRIPLQDRAAAATLAWMRHQTTDYDAMLIPQVKGQRREIRRKLAQSSRQLLQQYRRGEPTNPRTCPFWKALEISGDRGVEGLGPGVASPADS